jgi:hypothetical protein
MPWSYHSLEGLEFSGHIIPASSVPSNHMGGNTSFPETASQMSQKMLMRHISHV